MWTSISALILRNRITFLVTLAVITVFMAYQSQNVKMRYKFGGLLPETDSTYINYQKFLSEFSEDGNVVVLGVQDDEFFQLENFAAWYQLGEDLKKIKVKRIIETENGSIEEMAPAIDSIFSVAHAYNLIRNDEQKKFDFGKIVSKKPTTQQEVDSIKDILVNLPFYNGLLYNDSTDASLMMVFVNAKLFNSEDRGDAIEQVQAIVDEFSSKYMHTHYSGLPYIRTVVSNRIKGELKMFVGLAALITALILFLFFRSLQVVMFSMLVVITGVVWSMGIISLFGYELSAVMGLIPPLIIVIGVPNCVFLLNKYHSEFVIHGNKIKALSRVIQKIGNATFMTNTTTALGFATFIATHSSILKEFGVIASINIMIVFLLSIIMIPSIFSFLKEPKPKHTRHLDKKWLYLTVEKLVTIVTDHRKKVYIVTSVIVILGVLGLSKIESTGNIVDDLPKDDLVLVDLRFFESNFNGVMPLEILVDTRKKGGALKESNLKKIEKVQKLLAEYPEISKSLSIVDAVKFVKQSFYGGDINQFKLISGNEKSFIAPYISGKDNQGVASLFMDSLKQQTRITAQIADVGTKEMDLILNDLTPKIDEILNPDKYDTILTGTSIVYLKGTNYLVKNLFISLMIAIIIISSIMASLFRSARMVLVSLIPNLIPLLVTGAIMGFCGIPIKPSTILVFSIAFGISVDDTIHYLAKYRQELNSRGWNIKQSILNAVRETGVSMIYTSIVLFFGFGIFAASNFGGTVALGILVSVTLLVAMFANLVLLPSLLLSLEKSITTKAFKEPFIEIIDEEEDIDLDELVVQKVGTSPKELNPENK
jgi:predicted RND superfamily exporter protein